MNADSSSTLPGYGDDRSENLSDLEPLFGDRNGEIDDYCTPEENHRSRDYPLFGNPEIWEETIQSEAEPSDSDFPLFAPFCPVQFDSTTDGEDSPDMSEEPQNPTDNNDSPTDSLSHNGNSPSDDRTDDALPADDRPALPPFDPDADADFWDPEVSQDNMQGFLTGFSAAGAIGLIVGIIFGLLLFL